MTLVVFAVAQHGKERLQVTFETDAVLDDVHLGFQSSDFIKANLVNLIRGQICGGLVGKPLIVISRTVGQHPYPLGDFTGIDHVFLLPSDQSLVGRLPMIDQRRSGSSCQRIRLRLVDGFGFLKGCDFLLSIGPYRAVITACERCTGDNLTGAIDHTLERKAWWPHARSSSLLRQCNQLIKRHLGRLNT